MLMQGLMCNLCTDSGHCLRLMTKGLTGKILLNFATGPSEKTVHAVDTGMKPNTRLSTLLDL